MGLFGSKPGPIGLDIGSRNVKAVQLWRGGEGMRLLACAAFPRLCPDAPVTSEELGQISSILARKGLVGKDFVVPAPAEKLKSAILDLPAKVAGVPMEQIARAEFARVQKLELTTSEMSWWELPAPSRPGKGTVVMGVAYAHADAEPYLSLFQHAGLRVRAIDTPTSALARGCAALVAEKGTFGAIELGASAAVLVLVLGGVVVYERRIGDAGTSRLMQMLADRLATTRDAAEDVAGEVGVGAAREQSESRSEDPFGEIRMLIARHFDSTISEVRRTLAYASHQYAGANCETLVLCGGAAVIPGVDGLFAEQIGLEVRRADLSSALHGGGIDTARLGPAMAGALGLARFA